MGQKFIIDSNVIIDYIANRFDENSCGFLENIFNNNFQISVIVKIEVLGFNDLTPKLQFIEEFINTATIIYLDTIVTQKTIELRRLYKKLKLGDAIIAATALAYDFTLISRNLKDFKNIEGLKCIDAHNL
jgi:predicted nucleic acid-binding protein